MQIYQVGGAVRDRLLGLPVKDRDWLVVGARPEDLLSAGYTQVGADFPVFLHPKTREEYALARTEKKTGTGYHGFDSRFDPSVTLDEDLARRDLTINAIAEDEFGVLHDPYQGQKDIDRRILRHVTDAFTEDPLRVLRVARFLSRLKPLGFCVAEETLELMRRITVSGELQSLTTERVWKEISLALLSPEPAAFFECLREVGALKILLPELDCLFGVPQRAEYHPEVDTGVHTLMVLEQSAQLSELLEVRFAALVHDLGKGCTDPKQWPRHVGHENLGIKPVKALCQRLKVPKAVQQIALNVTKYHLQAHRAFELKPATVLKLIEANDGLRRPENFGYFLLASTADARGRLGFETSAYPQADYLRQALQACREVDVQALVAQGLKGAAIGEALRQQRAEAIRRVRDQWQQREEPADAC